MRASPVSRLVSQLCTNCSINGPRSTRSNRARSSSASARAASPMSLIRRSSRPTSSRAIVISRWRSSGSSTRSSPSTAERSEASGFLSSWVTSAAKASILSIRWRSDWLMSDTARARSPISSLREGRRGTLTSRDRPSRTRWAAMASRRSGRTIVRARKIERKHRDCDQHRHRAGDEAALAADRARECAIVVGREQHAAADRDGGGNDRRQVGRVADRGHGLARRSWREPPRATPRADRPAARRTRRAISRRRWR